MSDVEKILVDNLKESLHQLQRYMVFGLGASVFLFVMAFTVRNWRGGEMTVKLPSDFLPGPVSLPIAVAIVLSAYWVAGLLATTGVQRAKRIVWELKRASNSSQSESAPDASTEGREGPLTLPEAALTYPSIPTTRVHGPRIGLAILPAVLVISAALVSGFRPNEPWKALVVFILATPYLVLAGLLRTAVGGYSPDLRGD